MKEDLIERLTSMVFDDEQFSNTVLSLCAELTRSQQKQYLDRLQEIEGLKPIHVGISPYLTLDNTSNLEEIYMK